MIEQVKLANKVLGLIPFQCRLNNTVLPVKMNEEKMKMKLQRQEDEEEVSSTFFWMLAKRWTMKRQRQKSS